MSLADSQFNLNFYFDEINARHFDAFLDPIPLVWNERLRSTAGRFVPGSRKWLLQYPPRIEIATFLLQEPNAEALIRDTLAHEMIHYWLWVRKKPYGHTPEFWSKMTQMGVSRYSSVTRDLFYRYVYRCSACFKEFFTRKRLGELACSACCRVHSGGVFDSRFQLVLDRKLSREEGQKLFAQRKAQKEAKENLR